MILDKQIKNFPEYFYGVIEIPKGSSNKYEYNKDFNMIEFDRELSSSMTYPGNYGFVPKTLAEDGDPVDLIMLNTDPTIQSGALVKLKPLALLNMIDCGSIDNKVITTVLTEKNINDIDDVCPMFLRKTKDFFANYKNLDNQEVRLGSWENASTAKEYLKSRYENGGRGGN
jgi:inorganic pyrophosphatase